MKYLIIVLTIIVTLILIPVVLTLPSTLFPISTPPSPIIAYVPSLLLTTQSTKLPPLQAINYVHSTTYTTICTNAFNYASSLLSPTSIPTTIVLDLDETMFSGVGFNTYLMDTNTPYSYDVQLEYMSTHTYPLVPGALKFITYAQALGYTITFVTNRKPGLTTPTQAHLTQYGLSHIPVLYRTGVRDKAPRLGSLTNVFMTIGDKDNDHIPGIHNVYLPNPLY